MAIKFKSKAAPDLVMLSQHAHELLRVLGKDVAQAGILEPKDMPAALVVLQALSDDVAVSGQVKPESLDAEPEAMQDESAVSLHRRAWPLIQMIERSLAVDQPVVWEV
ncbi:MAG: DUF1840 domain-containing protein [Pseudomonadota bacterium]